MKGRLFHETRGQAIVEFAIVLPVLLLLLLGLIQFSLVFDADLTLEEAARVAVRAWATDQAITQAAVQTVAEDAMPNLIPADIGSVTLSCPQFAGGTCPNDSDPSNLSQPQGVLLQVTVPYTEPILVPPFDGMFGSAMALSASVVMESEAP